MSSSTEKPSGWTPTQTKVAWVFVSVVGLLLSCCFLQALLLSETFENFLSIAPAFTLGWFSFASNLYMMVPAVALFMLTSALLTWLLFAVTRRLLARHFKAAGESKSVRPIKLLALCAAIAVLTLSLGNIARNAFWLAMPENPVLSREIKTISAETAFRNGYYLVHELVQESAPGATRSTHRKYWDSRLPRQFEQVDIGFVTRPDGSIYAGYVIPRDPTQRTELGIAVAADLASTTTQPYRSYDQEQFRENARNWPALLKTLQEHANLPTPEPAK